MNTKLFSLILLISLAAATQAQQQQDSRELPVQITSSGMTILGLKTMLGSSMMNPKGLAKFPLGLLLVSAGLAGTLYTKAVLKQADAFHDIGCEIYYRDRIERLGRQCPPADATKYAFYMGKNMVQGNKVPQWIQKMQKDLYKK